MLERPPSPPPDLASRGLPIEKIDAGGSFYRIHQTAYGAKFFGSTGLWRFDSPTKAFGTMYAGLSPGVAFAETLIRGRGSLVAMSEIKMRSLCRFQVSRPIRLVKMFGPAMTKLQAAADVTTGEVAISQLWAQAFHDHPEQPDGILYRSKYDNDEFAVALFERCRASVDGGTTQRLIDDHKLLGSILDRYELGLV
ncbi:RES family NAD+ phosphorylase [Bradyrhizobium brasilense]|uniref:RES family NAD+ phosphorylase n=1 Tax=Bradyrhizobium brasilense TaxID=1419277 RepID=UPI002877630A|nr:RES family NAD+ phosphorylase [Bradyrhizobium brasilense]MCP3415736.1 RES family NAD+ phosphorylase [Bradyrhizobium brasilense]